MALPWTAYESPLGRLTIVLAARRGPAGIHFPGGPRLAEADARPMPEVTAQLDQYFAGERRGSSSTWNSPGPVSDAPSGAPARDPLRVDRQLRGDRRALGEEAFPAGLEPHERARAVGAEVGRTPVPIVVPCHRVIGADGSLTGYGGGLERKRALLDLESSQLALL